MRNFLITAGAALCCAAALPAAAAPASGETQEQAGARTDQPTQQQRARDPNRRICVAVRMSETRIPRRVCRTQAEWDEERAETD